MLLLASMMTSEGVWRFVALPWMIVFGVRFPPWLGLLYWVTEAFPEFATHRFPAISNPRPRGPASKVCGPPIVAIGATFPFAFLAKTRIDEVPVLQFGLVLLQFET